MSRKDLSLNNLKMKKLNIFERFGEYQARKVDNPNYTPLGQPILEQTPTKEEVRKVKRNEHAREYYRKNKKKMREYQKKYKMKHPQKYSYKGVPQKYWLKGVQLSVYDYMVEQYQLWDRVPRWTQIAKALGIWEQTVYNAVFSLVKKWLVGRWQAGKYYLINPPVKKEDVAKNEIEVVWETLNEPEMVYVEEDKYDSMVEKIKSLEEQVSNSVWHIEWLMNSNTELEKKNMGLLHQIEELKLLIKLLYKYFGNV